MSIARSVPLVMEKNVFEFGVPVLHEILRELQSYVVSKLREKLNTIKQVLPLLHHSHTQAIKSKLALVKNAYARYSTYT